jgi:hypothetical protein
VQNLNTEFSVFFRKVAYKYYIDLDKDGLKPFDPNSVEGYGDGFVVLIMPIRMTKENGLKWVAHVLARTRGREASAELARIMEDTKGYPINYDDYYTDTIKSRRQNRAALAETMKQASKMIPLPT